MDIKLTVRLDKETHKKLKKKIIDSEYKSLQELSVKLFKDWLSTSK